MNKNANLILIENICNLLTLSEAISQWAVDVISENSKLTCNRVKGALYGIFCKTFMFIL